jgi:hypothetical protein
LATVEKHMDLATLEEIVKAGDIIKTPEGFMGELKWLLHNTRIWKGIPVAPKDSEECKKYEDELFVIYVMMRMMK